jgi:hypothetical protein
MMASLRWEAADGLNDSGLERAVLEELPDESRFTPENTRHDKREEEEKGEEGESDDILLDLEQSLTWFEAGESLLKGSVVAPNESATSRHSEGSLSTLGWLHHDHHQSQQSHQQSRSSLRYPRVPRSPTRLIRFATVLATDVPSHQCSSLGHGDLLDLMESYKEDDHHSQSTHSSDSMDIFEQQQQPQSQKAGLLHESQTSLTLSLEHDDENDLHDLPPMNRDLAAHRRRGNDFVPDSDWQSEDLDQDEDNENKKVRRQMMYAVGTAGLFALVGWAGKIIWRIFHTGDDDPAGGQIHGNTTGGVHHPAIVPPDSAPVLLLHHDGGLSPAMDPSASMSQAGFSQSSTIGATTTAGGGGVYPGGAEQVAANPALQRYVRSMCGGSPHTHTNTKVEQYRLTSLSLSLPVRVHVIPIILAWRRVRPETLEARERHWQVSIHMPLKSLLLFLSFFLLLKTHTIEHCTHIYYYCCNVSICSDVPCCGRSRGGGGGDDRDRGGDHGRHCRGRHRGDGCHVVIDLVRKGKHGSPPVGADRL